MSSVFYAIHVHQCDRQTDGQTPHHSIYRAMHARRAGKKLVTTKLLFVTDSETEQVIDLKPNYAVIIKD